MKKTIWTTDHRTLEHYREMSSMPFSVDLMRAYMAAALAGPSECCFQGLTPCPARFHHITRLMERRACLPP